MANEPVNKVVLADGRVLIDLSGDNTSPSDVLVGRRFHDKSGTERVGTCSFDSNTQDATAVEGDVLLGRSAYARGNRIIGTMPNKSGEDIVITAIEPVSIPRGYYDGSGTVGVSDADQAKLIPDNIRQGVTILGVLGEMSGSEGVVAQAKTVNPKFTSQTVTPDVNDGYTHLSGVTVNPIAVAYSQNAAGGYTVTIGEA